MFALSVNDTYTTPVKVQIPDGTGKSTTHTFKAKFRRVEQEELEEIQRRYNESKLLEGETLMTDRKLLESVLVGWEEVSDAKGAALEFNDENFKLLLSIYPTQPTLAKSFFDSLSVGRQKN